jgi:hypothetical protein
MTTDKHCGQDEQTNDFAGSLAEAHSLCALEQSARYAAQLAIARWINASARASLPLAATAAMARAAWYARAQQNFQEWLGRGGFAQYDHPCADRGSQPAGDEAAQRRLPDSGARPIDICID